MTNVSRQKSTYWGHSEEMCRRPLRLSDQDITQRNMLPFASVHIDQDLSQVYSRVPLASKGRPKRSSHLAPNPKTQFWVQLR